MTTVVNLVKPVPWKRTLGSGNKRYTHPTYRAWKDQFGWEAKQAHVGPVWDWPTVVGIRVAANGIWVRFVPWGETVELDLTPITERPKGLRGDLDNYVKAILDASQGVVIVNDSQIVSIYATFTDEIGPVDLLVPEDWLVDYE